MPDEKLPQRALKTAALLAAFVCITACAYGRYRLAAGFAVGAAIGLSSLWSLTIGVPRLLTPGRGRGGMWLVAAAAIKLPIYAVLLYISLSWGANPLAIFGGAAVVPGVIVLKVLGYQLVAASGRPERDLAAAKSPSTSAGL